MAEPERTEGTEGTEETQGTTGGQATQPETLTAERIADLMAATVAAQLGPVAQAFNALREAREEDRAVILSLREAQERDRAAILDIVGSNKRNTALLDTIFDETRTPEDRAAARERINNQIKAEATEAELVRLKAADAARATEAESARQKANAAAAAQAAKQDTPPRYNEESSHYLDFARPPLATYAKKQGVDIAVVEKTWTGRPLKGQNRAEQWAEFDEYARGEIDRMADAAREQEQERSGVTVDNTRPSGGVRKDRLQSYQEALRTGGKVPAVEEIDRIAAEWVAANR